MTSGSWLRRLTAALVVAAAVSLPAGDALARGGGHAGRGHRFRGHHGLRPQGSFGFHHRHGFHHRPFRHNRHFGFRHHHGFHAHPFRYYDSYDRVFPGPVRHTYSGARFYDPSGIALSHYDAESGTTYCLSLRTGFYYVCGYSQPAHEPVGPVPSPPPGALAPRGEQGLPPPSGALLFDLPQDAEATVNGIPVGLSSGLGITAVPPGRYRVVVRASGTETEHSITVDSHTILTVTPASVVPAAP